MPLVLRGDTIHQHIDSQEGYVWGLPPSFPILAPPTLQSTTSDSDQPRRQAPGSPLCIHKLCSFQAASNKSNALPYLGPPLHTTPWATDSV